MAALAHGYIVIGQFAVLPGLLYNVLRALVSAIGKAAVVLNVTIAMLVLNAAALRLPAGARPFRPAGHGFARGGDRLGGGADGGLLLHPGYVQRRPETGATRY